MCPPPADPIRPVGPVGGDVYVERSAFAERVARRRQRDDDGQPRDRHHPQPDEDEPDVPTDWLQVAAPLTAAGAYDDHGRIAGPDVAETVHEHIDTSA